MTGCSPPGSLSDSKVLHPSKAPVSVPPICDCRKSWRGVSVATRPRIRKPPISGAISRSPGCWPVTTHVLHCTRALTLARSRVRRTQMDQRLMHPSCAGSHGTFALAGFLILPAAGISPEAFRHFRTIFCLFCINIPSLAEPHRALATPTKIFKSHLLIPTPFRAVPANLEPALFSVTFRKVLCF